MTEKLFKHQIIRLGSNHDGGYFVCPNAVTKSQNLIGIGIETNWEFEKEFLKINPKVKVTTYDGQTNIFLILKFFFKQILKILIFKINWDLLKRSFLNIFEYKYFLIKKLNFVNKNVGLLSGLSFKKIVEGKKNIFLKIDIEGSEYRILNQIINYKEMLTGLAIEFHDYDLNKDRVHDFINEIEMELIHVHVNELGGISCDNTPIALEFSFSKYPLKKNVGKAFFEIPNLKGNKFISLDSVRL